ncbi:MAG TPA: hypothetical protein VIB62_00755 [Actinomycetota bacterium]|jgi:hypothetical protein
MEDLFLLVLLGLYAAVFCLFIVRIVGAKHHEGSDRDASDPVARSDDRRPEPR